MPANQPTGQIAYCVADSREKNLLGLGGRGVARSNWCGWMLVGVLANICSSDGRFGSVSAQFTGGNENCFCFVLFVCFFYSAALMKHSSVHYQLVNGCAKQTLQICVSQYLRKLTI